MREADFAGLIEIGDGRRIYLECAGSGGPTVILESGYGHSGRIWTTDVRSIDWSPPDRPRTTVFDGVSKFARVRCYDRPGTLLPTGGSFEPSRSDPAPMPRSAEALVDDLHTLLKAAGIPGPYVFVGHSLGGLLGRLFLARYPEEIAGLVLVDSFSAQLWNGLRQSLSPDDWAAFEALETAPRLELQAVYPAVELLDLDGITEDRAFNAIASLPPRPVVVLARGRSTEQAVPAGTLSADFPWDIVELESRAAQDALVRLFPGARFEIAAESGHMIQLDQPELVIEAVRAVVTTVQASNRACKEIPAATGSRGGYSKGSTDRR